MIATLWHSRKRQNCGDSKKISGCQGFGGKEGARENTREREQGSETTLYDTMMVRTSYRVYNMKIYPNVNYGHCKLRM